MEGDGLIIKFIEGDALDLGPAGQVFQSSFDCREEITGSAALSGKIGEIS